MKNLYDRLWIRVAMVLSVAVGVIGFPVFQRTKGFPSSVFWTLAVIAGVWLTYLIRAWAWGGTRDPREGSGPTRE